MTSPLPKHDDSAETLVALTVDNDISKETKVLEEALRKRNILRAIAINSVTVARIQDGRTAEIATDDDAATSDLIFQLLLKVAGGKGAPLDPIFAKGVLNGGKPVNTAMERALAAKSSDKAYTADKKAD